MTERTHRFTNRQKMQAAQREVGYRRYVFPKRVAAGKMTQRKADEEIAIMAEIAFDYGHLAECDDIATANAAALKKGAD